MILCLALDRIEPQIAAVVLERGLSRPAGGMPKSWRRRVAVVNNKRVVSVDMKIKEQKESKFVADNNESIKKNSAKMANYVILVGSCITLLLGRLKHGTTKDTNRSRKKTSSLPSFYSKPLAKTRVAEVEVSDSNHKAREVLGLKKKTKERGGGVREPTQKASPIKEAKSAKSIITSLVKENQENFMNADGNRKYSLLALKKAFKKLLVLNLNKFVRRALYFLAVYNRAPFF